MLCPHRYTVGLARWEYLMPYRWLICAEFVVAYTWIVS